MVLIHPIRRSTEQFSGRRETNIWLLTSTMNTNKDIHTTFYSCLQNERFEQFRFLWFIQHQFRSRFLNLVTCHLFVFFYVSVRKKKKSRTALDTQWWNKVGSNLEGVSEKVKSLERNDWFLLWLTIVVGLVPGGLRNGKECNLWCSSWS